MKLVRALRKGWIKKEQAPEKPTAYLFWEDDGERGRALGAVAAYTWRPLCGALAGVGNVAGGAAVGIVRCCAAGRLAG